jgi:hypothetical protein
MKKTVTVKIDEALLERIRRISYWTPGITITSFIEESLEICVNAYEEKSGALPPREGLIKKGRPFKTSDIQEQLPNQ